MPSVHPSVTAIVVTYNRKELLQECLNAILSQTRSVDRIILIDNASTDGTFETLQENGFFAHEQLDYRRMDSNTGGAGGFCEGLRIARESETDWLWLMDDDTIPAPEALQKLLEAKEAIREEVSFLCSSVYGPDGEAMNVPNLSETTDENGYRNWYHQLKNKAVKVADATFVSILINRKALDRCGLPCKDFFIWGDDTEYTMRIIANYGPAYLIGDSEVIHKRFNARSLSIKEETDEKRIGMYFYFFRNILIIRKLYGMKTFSRFLLGAIRTSLTSLPKEHSFKKFLTIHKGILHYFKERSHFENYINEQLKGESHV